MEFVLGLLFGIPTLLGWFTIYHWIRPAKGEVDKSNVFNKMVLWWFALTREDKFVDKFPWLKNDEWENRNGGDINDDQDRS